MYFWKFLCHGQNIKSGVQTDLITFVTCNLLIVLIFISGGGGGERLKTSTNQVHCKKRHEIKNSNSEFCQVRWSDWSDVLICRFAQ